MEITYYGHSCYMLNLGGFQILFDPFITPNELATDIDISSIKPDYILVSHAHEDHIADLETIAKQSDAIIVANWEIHTYYQKRGFAKTHPMNIGGKWDFEFGTLKMVNAVHSSSFPDGTYGGNPAGFTIETAERTIYYAGDTALFSDMKLIGEQQKIDLAFLPIGDNFTMDVEDAVIAAHFLNTKNIIGMHYNTFPYIEIDPVYADLAFSNEEKSLTLMSIGETISL